VDGVFFTVDQLTCAGPLPDEPHLAGWWIDGMGVSYRGKAVASVEWDADRVCTALNRLAQRLGENVAKGRLYSRTPLED
jgi:hypothetical protein